MSSRPFIVGIGGTTQPGSSTEQALRLALDAAAAAGAETFLFGSAQLVALPHYLTPAAADNIEAHALVAAIRRADGVLIASPGYHGSISGLVKNAIDYLEETARDARPYLDGRAVGLIATAYGWQAANTTLSTLRSITHALRGWPTPMGAAINSAGGIFKDGTCTDDRIAELLRLVAAQVLGFRDRH